MSCHAALLSERGKGTELEPLVRVDYDAELQRYREALRYVWGIRPNDRVLDVGCGAGQTTCDPARETAAGFVLGVDISAALIDRARERAKSEGPANVAFAHAHAATYSFNPEDVDIAISRFGTMLFDDPPAAFANLARALRSGGRLVMLVWQAAEQNEWTMSIRRALGIDTRCDRDLAKPDAFSLGDPRVVERILDTAGFRDVTFTSVREPLYYGADVVAALDWVRGFSNVRRMLDRMAAPEREHALAALREMLSAHDTGRGIWFDSAAWIVSARKVRTDPRMQGEA